MYCVPAHIMRMADRAQGLACLFHRPFQADTEFPGLRCNALLHHAVVICLRLSRFRVGALQCFQRFLQVLLHFPRFFHVADERLQLLEVPLRFLFLRLRLFQKHLSVPDSFEERLFVLQPVFQRFLRFFGIIQTGGCLFQIFFRTLEFSEELTLFRILRQGLFQLGSADFQCFALCLSALGRLLHRNQRFERTLTLPDILFEFLCAFFGFLQGFGGVQHGLFLGPDLMERQVTEPDAFLQRIHFSLPGSERLKFFLCVLQLIQKLIGRLCGIHGARSICGLSVRLRVRGPGFRLRGPVPFDDPFQRAQKVRIGRVIFRLFLIRHAGEIKGTRGSHNLVCMRLPLREQTILRGLQDILEGAVAGVIKEAGQDRLALGCVRFEERAELALGEHDDLPELPVIQAQELLRFCRHFAGAVNDLHAFPFHDGFL